MNSLIHALHINFNVHLFTIRGIRYNIEKANKREEYFEKELMNQEVDFWFPQEELLFVSPIVPHIDEYLFSIKKDDGSGNIQKILTQRIDLNQINKITS